MARRKNASSELNLDSLMDTVTNVVGVLMIIFIMMALNIARTVNRILSELPPVTIEELADLKHKLEQLPPPPDTEENIKKKTELTEETAKKLTEELKTIDLSAVQQGVKFMDLDEIRQKIERAKYDRDKEKAELDKLFAEVDRLKKLLDTTPEYKPPPPAYVRIPNPRPIPAGAVREAFLLANGRVIYLNDRAFMDVVQRELLKNRDALLADNHPKVNSSTPPASIRYSKDKVLAWAERARIGDRTLQVKLAALPTAPAFNVQLTPMEGAGESEQELRNPASFFQRALRKFKGEPNKVVWFYVFKDSVPTYLAAREIADSIGVPVGWQITGQEFFSMRLPNVAYAPFTAPPAPTTPASEIAAPKEQLD